MGSVLSPTIPGPAADDVASSTRHRSVNLGVVVEFRDAGEHRWHTVGIGADEDLHHLLRAGAAMAKGLRSVGYTARVVALQLRPDKEALVAEPPMPLLAGPART
jgi:hypothetical protein